MSSKKTAKQSASSAPATEKARKAAQAEIQKRIDAIESETEAPAAPAAADAQAPKADQPAAKAKPAKTPPPVKTKRVSALDAAASILATAKEPMRAKEIVADMATQGLWKSPGGLTPEATLYAAMLREIKAKGPDARFVKSDRGLFSAAGR